MLEPNLERLKEIIWKGRSYKKNFAEDIFANYRKIEVEVRTLDAFAAEHSVGYIDYLKIDVEGSEYEVFEGGRSILQHTGVIKVETCFIPFRKEQRLFSHVDLLLRDFGFDLLRYEIDPRQVGYKQRRTPVEYVPGHRFADPYGQPLSCDAIYVNRRVRDPERALAQAIILLDKKYVDEALYILRTRTAVRDDELFDMLESVESYDAIGYRLKAIGYQFVDTVVDAAARVRQFVGV